MTDPVVTLEAYIITPGSVLAAARDAATGNNSAVWLIKSLAESIIALRRTPKLCMLGCGKRMRDVKGERAPAAFVILIPMFPHTGPHTDRAISSPICRDCFERWNFIARLKEVLATDYECTIRDAVTQ